MTRVCLRSYSFSHLTYSQACGQTVENGDPVYLSEALAREEWDLVTVVTWLFLHLPVAFDWALHSGSGAPLRPGGRKGAWAQAWSGTWACVFVSKQNPWLSFSQCLQRQILV